MEESACVVSPRHSANAPMDSRDRTARYCSFIDLRSYRILLFIVLDAFFRIILSISPDSHNDNNDYGNFALDEYGNRASFGPVCARPLRQWRYGNLQCSTVI